MDVEYTWILGQFKIVVNLAWKEEVEERGNVILTRCKFNFIRELENLAQDPSYKISIA